MKFVRTLREWWIPWDSKVTRFKTPAMWASSDITTSRHDCYNHSAHFCWRALHDDFHMKAWILHIIVSPLVFVIRLRLSLYLLSFVVYVCDKLEHLFVAYWLKSVRSLSLNMTMRNAVDVCGWGAHLGLIYLLISLVNAYEALTYKNNYDEMLALYL